MKRSVSTRYVPLHLVLDGEPPRYGKNEVIRMTENKRGKEEIRNSRRPATLMAIVLPTLARIATSVI
jgi:hypothetical protein